MRTFRQVIALADQTAITFPDSGSVVIASVYGSSFIVESERKRLETVHQESGSVAIVGKVNAINEMSAVAAVAQDGLRPTAAVQPLTYFTCSVDCRLVLGLGAGNICRALGI